MKNILIGAILITTGVFLIALKLLRYGAEVGWEITIFGGVLILLGAYVAIDQRLQSFKVLNIIEIVFAQRELITKREAPAPRNLAVKQDFASGKNIPGRDAPVFNAVNLVREMPDSLLLPTASPMVPMYRLDKHFRIIEWNDAFSLAFDNTMDGLRSKSALDWVYYLENYQEVIDRGESVFSNGKGFPPIDVETLKFQSDVYGALTATKRAYQVPDDDAKCAGWLVILNVEFADPEKANQFNFDIVSLLSRRAIWSEYNISYDAVLMNSDVYPELLDTIMGRQGDLVEIPANTKILDLGAGTGNLAYRLVSDPDNPRLVYALENNQTMLNSLEQRCRNFITDDETGSGIIVLNQDIHSLAGFENNSFDYAVMNNVLYSLTNPERCLREVLRVLKPDGEIRISGPKENSDIAKLFRRIRKDLKKKGKFSELKNDLDRAESINIHFLKSYFKGWRADKLETMLKDAGFNEIIYKTERAYAGQALLVAARK